MRQTSISAVGLFFAFVIAGCASGSGEPNEQLTSVLDDLDTGTEYTATKRCLSNFEYDTVEVLDERHLLFKDEPGGEKWLNTLRSRCPGLHRNDTLLFEKTGNRLCNLDTAEVVERFLFWRRTGPVCSLGEFHELTENQANLIREATRS